MRDTSEFPEFPEEQLGATRTAAVTSVPTAMTALQQLLESPPDLILLDLGLLKDGACARQLGQAGGALRAPVWTPQQAKAPDGVVPHP